MKRGDDEMIGDEVQVGPEDVEMKKKNQGKKIYYFGVRALVWPTRQLSDQSVSDGYDIHRPVAGGFGKSY